VVPYIIKQGDYLAKVAFRFGFDPGEVWNDPKNAGLKAQRDPNILAPGDVLFIPGRRRPAPAPLELGGDNHFACDVPEVPIRIRLVDERGAPHAGKACTVEGLGEPLHIAADGDGGVSVSVPVTTRSVFVTIDDLGFRFEAAVGYLDPIGETSGRGTRLDNLGFLLDPDAADADQDREAHLAAALSAFQAAHGAPPGKDPWTHVADVYGC
jgi:hypothetical protein